MKEIYSFFTEKTVEKEVPVIKKNKEGKIVETTKKESSTVKTRVVFLKPSISTLEEAEFFYGQKYNEYINAGFLTKAMLSKKMGDLGGFSSKLSLEGLQKSIIENINAAKVIEFYEGASDLSKEQKEKLEDAKELFAVTKAQVLDYEQTLRSQFSQTADAKAEQKLIEWLVFFQSFYEEELEGKKQLFPLFEGDSFEEKRASYLSLCEEIEDIESPQLLKVKTIFDQGFTTLVRAASIWYNKIGNDQKEIDEAIKEMFPEEAEVKVEEKLEEQEEKKESEKKEEIEKGSLNEEEVSGE